MKYNFSVLISIYKKNKLVEIKDLFESINLQSFQPNEIIVVLDGFVTNIIRSFLKKYKNVKIIQNHKNLGLGYSLKKGVIEAKNDLIIRCDADDINVKNRFKILYKSMLLNPNYDVIGSYQLEILNKYKYLKFVPTDHKEIKKLLPYRNCINHPTVIFRKKSVIKSGNYMNVGDFLNCNNFEDYFLWLSMLKKNCKFYNINKILVISKINTNFYERRWGKNILKNYEKFLNLSYKKNFINYFQFLINLILRRILYNISLKKFILIFKIFRNKI